MSEPQIEQTEVKAPAKRKPAKKRKVAKATKEKPVTGEFAGITAKDCPAGCTAQKCVISTVGVCAHPFKGATNGFGPVTMANREKARKLVEHQIIDMTG